MDEGLLRRKSEVVQIRLFPSKPNRSCLFLFVRGFESSADDAGIWFLESVLHHNRSHLMLVSALDALS